MYLGYTHLYSLPPSSPTPLQCISFPIPPPPPIPLSPAHAAHVYTGEEPSTREWAVYWEPSTK